MLFDLHPKESLRDLFGREEELRELSRLVKTEWVAVLGKRMVGKTSLVKTFANEVGGVYVNLMGARGIGDLVGALARCAGFEVSEVKLDVRVVAVRWTRVAEDVFARLEGKVIVLDEVQEVSSPIFLRLLKRLWDSYPKLRIVFSGSMIGVMRRLLEPKQDSPLYGREPAKIVLRPFPRNVALDFLAKGFEECGMVAPLSELEEVVERFDGYVGWLTHYGNFRAVRKMRHSEALAATAEEAVMVWASELEHFLEGRRRDLYVKILRMASRGARWSEMKRELGVNSKVLRDALRNLVDAMMVEGRNGYYTMPDALLREAVGRVKLA